MSHPTLSALSCRRQVPINIGLLELIRAKREWCWKPSHDELKKGFRGWHQRGYLPHFDAPNVTQFVTFHLADSFPITRRREWEGILNEPSNSIKRRKLEAWLDRGYGECWLRRHHIANIAEDALRERDGIEFALRAWVIMPNHVHTVVDVWDVPLSRLIADWKGRAARYANQQLRRMGKQFWQADYFDTLVRDEEHLAKVIRYTEQNPGRAYSMKDSREWLFSSARHRDQYERLPGEI